MNNKYLLILLVSLLTAMPFAQAMDKKLTREKSELELHTQAFRDGKTKKNHTNRLAKSDTQTLDHKLREHLNNFMQGKTRSTLSRTFNATCPAQSDEIDELSKHFASIKLAKVNKKFLGAVQSKDTTDDTAITTVEKLLQEGADINAHDTKGWTPLLHAGLTAFNPKLVKYLLQEGADPQDAFYIFALAGAYQLLTPIITYVPTSYLNALSNKSMEVDTEAREYATKKITLLKQLCSVTFKDGKTIAQKISAVRLPGKQELTISQLLVLDMLEVNNLKQHRNDIVMEFKRRLFGN